MRKQLKKLFAIFLALTMVLGLAPQAFALEDTNASGQSEEIYPEFNYEETFGNIIVSLKTQEGVLPEGTTATIEQVQYDDVQDDLDEQLSKNKTLSVDTQLFDITLHNQEGETIQPKGNVEITIKNGKLDIPSDYAKHVTYDAIRLNNDGSLTTLSTNVDMSKAEVTFNNDHFSKVGIIAKTAMPIEEDVQPLADVAPTTDISNGRYVGPYEGSHVGPTKDEIAIRYFHNGEYYLTDVGTGTTYIAYCFDYGFANPIKESTSGQYLQKPIVNATGQEFFDLAGYGKRGNGIKNLSPYGNDPELFKRCVLWVVYAGYPYNATEVDFLQMAKNHINKPSVSAESALRNYTQLAIWHFTDYGEKENNDEARVSSGPAKALVDYALEKAKAGETPPITLDLFPMTLGADGKSSQQSLLVTQVKKRR